MFWTVPPIFKLFVLFQPYNLIAVTVNIDHFSLFFAKKPQTCEPLFYNSLLGNLPLTQMSPSCHCNNCSNGLALGLLNSRRMDTHRLQRRKTHGKNSSTPWLFACVESFGSSKHNASNPLDRYRYRYCSSYPFPTKSATAWPQTTASFYKPVFAAYATIANVDTTAVSL